MPSCLIIKQGEWVCLGLSVGGRFGTLGPVRWNCEIEPLLKKLLQTPKDKGKVWGVAMVKMNRHSLSSVRPRDVRGLEA
jgi:hypothetical protein